MPIIGQSAADFLNSHRGCNRSRGSVFCRPLRRLTFSTCPSAGFAGGSLAQSLSQKACPTEFVVHLRGGASCSPGGTTVSSLGRQPQGNRGAPPLGLPPPRPDGRSPSGGGRPARKRGSSSRPQPRGWRHRATDGRPSGTARLTSARWKKTAGGRMGSESVMGQVRKPWHLNFPDFPVQTDLLGQTLAANQAGALLMRCLHEVAVLSCTRKP